MLGIWGERVRQAFLAFHADEKLTSPSSPPGDYLAQRSQCGRVHGPFACGVMSCQVQLGVVGGLQLSLFSS